MSDALTNATGVLASRLARGGQPRLDALAKIKLLLSVDCGHEMGRWQVWGGDGKEAAESYRAWLHDWIDEALDEFLAGWESTDD